MNGSTSNELMVSRFVMGCIWTKAMGYKAMGPVAFSWGAEVQGPQAGTPGTLRSSYRGPTI